jgi:hypothetical protein
VRPVTLTDATLISSTVAEPSGSDPAVWNGGTTYAAGALVRLAATHRVYESLQAANTANDPNTTGSLWWSEVSGTNRWAMFDGSVSSATSGATPLTVVMAPGIVDALVLLGCVGNTATITVTDARGSSISRPQRSATGMPTISSLSDRCR